MLSYLLSIVQLRRRKGTLNMNVLYNSVHDLLQVLSLEPPVSSITSYHTYADCKTASWTHSPDSTKTNTIFPANPKGRLQRIVVIFDY